MFAISLNNLLLGHPSGNASVIFQPTDAFSLCRLKEVRMMGRRIGKEAGGWLASTSRRLSGTIQQLFPFRSRSPKDEKKRSRSRERKRSRDRRRKHMPHIRRSLPVPTPDNDTSMPVFTVERKYSFAVESKRRFLATVREVKRESLPSILEGNEERNWREERSGKRRKRLLVALAASFSILIIILSIVLIFLFHVNKSK